jgi:hypothetical protein
MEIVGGIFADKQDLVLALHDLDEQGFVAFNVFGPSELFRAPDTDEEIEESIESPRHTAMGTVDGISVSPRPYIPDDPSAQPVTDDLTQLGVPEKLAETFVAGLQQDKLLLLLKSKESKADEAVSVMEERGAILYRATETT